MAADPANLADKWQQWAIRKRPNKREREDLILCEADEATICHMQVRQLHGPRDDGGEGEDICRQMKMLRSMPEVREGLPFPSGCLMPPMLKRSSPGTVSPPRFAPRNVIPTNTLSLDSSSIHSVKSTSSTPPPLKDIEQTPSGAALPA